MLWYTREASVAVYVANLPGIWPLLREHIRFLRDHTNSYITGQSRTPQYGYGSHSHMSKSARSRIRTVNGTNVDSDEVELGESFGRSGAHSINSNEKNGKAEEMGNPYLSSAPSATSGRPSQESDERALTEWKNIQGMSVQVDTRVEIQRDSWDGSRMESGMARTVKIEGPDGDTHGRR
jgi:hypothetical protein